ncbi:hypothetical protein E2C01_049411 [Portunus trituberculatus]|uniref:Uncharacterized protein n=1 Tax=Portunus trituberculatus TaxID=210409 RepID=A0A5B7GDW3_PORTR|nr:hypothetical protein [Portunus trituberculatus]
MEEFMNAFHESYKWRLNLAVEVQPYVHSVDVVTGAGTGLHYGPSSLSWEELTQYSASWHSVTETLATGDYSEA